MGIEGEPPTSEQVAYIRRKIAEYVSDNGQDVFDPRDVHRLNTETAYVERFFMHMYDLPGSQEDNAVNMAINTFKWRKELKVHEIKSDNLNPRLKAAGELYIHGRDKDGKVLMVFAVKKHVKGTENMDEQKKFFIYSLERIDRENNGDQLTLVFDCAGCGLKNMDMELIQYMITVFKDYYPWSLNYILVFEMPWVLNAAWKIIKTWLPAGAVKKIKFLAKNNIEEYVAENQRPPAWGGTDDWEYQWEEEEITQELTIPNGDASEEDSDDASQTVLNHINGIDETYAKKKSVSFAEAKTPNLASADSFRSQVSVSIVNGSAPIQIPGMTTSTSDTALSSSPSSSLTPLLSITPSDEIVFSLNNAGDLSAKVQIKNIAPKSVAFKIKTTSPEKFRVRPSMASLQPGATASIEINVASSHLPNVLGGASVGQIMSILVKEKFLFTASTINTEGDGNMSQAQLSEVMKSLRPEAQYRLRCTYLAGKELVAKGVGLAGVGQDSEKLVKLVESLGRKVSHLTEVQESLQANIVTLKRWLLLTFIMVAALFVFTYFTSQNLGMEKLFREVCQTIGDTVQNNLDVTATPSQPTVPTPPTFDQKDL